MIDFYDLKENYIFPLVAHKPLKKPEDWPIFVFLCFFYVCMYVYFYCLCSQSIEMEGSSIIAETVPKQRSTLSDRETVSCRTIMAGRPEQREEHI